MRLIYLSFCLLMALAPLQTLSAFEREQAGTRQLPVTAAQPVSDKRPSASVKEEKTAKGEEEPSSGLPIRIPGLGTVGVIPKMDFGMELLYGAEAKPALSEQEKQAEEDPDGWQIRGTIRHRF